MLLSNSSIGNAHRVLVMAAASPQETNDDGQSKNDQFLTAVTYNSAASVVKQRNKSSHFSTALNNGTLAAGSGNVTRTSNKYGEFIRPRISPKMKYRYDSCVKYGNWKRDRRADGSLPSGVKSYDSLQYRTTSSRPASDCNNDSGTSFGDSGKPTLSYHMVKFAGSSENQSHLGPLINSGASYSAIGLVSLSMLADHSGLPTGRPLSPISKSLVGYTSLKDGTSDHASSKRRLLGSISMNAYTDNGNSFSINQLVLDGLPQWVIARNVTDKANIENIGQRALLIDVNGAEDLISTADRGRLSYIELLRFFAYENSIPYIPGTSDSTLSCMPAISLTDSPWPKVRRVIDRVHRHVCEHASFSAYKVLFKNN